MAAGARATYRHGDLAAALLVAGRELARAGGPSAIVLREATRRVGVSPNAAYRHFADHRALLHAVAASAMSDLATCMETHQERLPGARDPQTTALARLRAVGAGYLSYAQDEPGLFRTAFTAADELASGQGQGRSGLAPFELLSAALDDLVTVRLLPESRRPDAELLAWSSVHGLAMLLIDGPLRHLQGDHAQIVVDQLLDHVERGLLPELHPTRLTTVTELRD